MNMKLSILAGAFVAFTSFGVSADELIVTSDSAKAGGMLALDLATEGKTVGLQAKIALPKGVNADQVNLKSCLADLPASHKGNCVMLDDQVLVLVYSDTNEALPAGLVSIGRVGFPGAKGGDIAVTELILSDAQANPLAGTHRVVGSDKPMSTGRKNQVK